MVESSFLHPAYAHVRDVALAWTASREQAEQQARVIIRALFDGDHLAGEYQVRGGLVVKSGGTFGSVQVRVGGGGAAGGTLR